MFVCHFERMLRRAPLSECFGVRRARLYRASKPVRSASTPCTYVDFHEGESKGKLEALRGAGRGKLAGLGLVFDGAD